MSERADRRRETSLVAWSPECGNYMYSVALLVAKPFVAGLSLSSNTQVTGLTM